MTYIHKPNVSEHQRYYNNPLNPILPVGGYGYFIIHISSRKGLVQEGGTDHIRCGIKILGHAVIRRIRLFGLWNQKIRGEYGENLIGD